MRHFFTLLLLAMLLPMASYAEIATSVTYQAHEQAKQEYKKPIHYLGLGLKVGYSQFNQGFNKSGTIGAGNMHSDLSIPGGANAGLEFRYKLEYKLFRMTVGVDATYAGSSIKGKINYDYPVVLPTDEMTYYYNFANVKEQQHAFEVGIPIMFGANYRGFYAMAGMRIGLPVMKTYSLQTDLNTTIHDHRGIDDYSDMENHYLTSTKQKNSDKGLKLSALNPQVALEVGYNLDPYMQRQYTWQAGGPKPSFVQLLHYEIALYANVGVMNYHNDKKTETFYQTDPANDIRIADVQSLTDDKNLAKGNLLPWNIGVRFNVYYEFYEKPVEKVARKRRPRPKKEKKEVVEEVVVEEVQDTIVYNGETIQKGDTIIMENLYFDTDKSTIRQISDESLNELASLLQSHPTMKITLIGHTDNVGKADYNMRLSKARVESVKSELIKRGIDGTRINTVGRGMTQPIADNSTREGRALNRRVEIVIDEE